MIDKQDETPTTVGGAATAGEREEFIAFGMTLADLNSRKWLEWAWASNHYYARFFRAARAAQPAVPTGARVLQGIIDAHSAPQGQAPQTPDPPCPKCRRDAMDLQWVCERCGHREAAPPPDAPRKDLGSSRSVASSGVGPECPTAVVDRMRQSSAMLRILPRHPDSNGSVLLIDDVEAARIALDMERAIGYIAWLETEADPAGTIGENWRLTQENASLQALLQTSNTLSQQPAHMNQITGEAVSPLMREIDATIAAMTNHPTRHQVNDDHSSSADATEGQTESAVESVGASPAAVPLTTEGEK